MTDIIEENNCCVICGEIIPEGRQVCRKCEMAVELQKNIKKQIEKESESNEKIDN